MSQSRLQVWISAARLRAFPLALSCIGMGGFLAAERGMFDPIIVGWAIITTILLQLTSNLANDLGDTQHGADHSDREGPSRAVQQGLISQQQMKTAVIICAVLSLLSGIVLTFLGVHSWQDALLFIGLGILAVLAAIGYTMGKKPYGYLGLGDLSVFIFFGWVGVVGSYYLQTHQLDASIFLPASACSFFAVAVLNINNIRDINSDRLAGKNTFALRLGHRGARIYHIILLLAGLLCAMYYTILNEGSWLYLAALPFVVWNGYQTLRRHRPQEIDPLVRQMAFTSLIFMVLFGLSVLA